MREKSLVDILFDEKGKVTLELWTCQNAVTALTAERDQLREELDTATKRAAEFHQMYEPEMKKLMGMFELLNSPDDKMTRLELALKYIQDMPPDMTCQEIDEICHAALWVSP